MHISDPKVWFCLCGIISFHVSPFKFNFHTYGWDIICCGGIFLAFLQVGESLAGRTGASLLTAAGVRECIHKDKTEMLNHAVQLACNPRMLLLSREKVVDFCNNSEKILPNCFARKLVAAMRVAWNRKLQQLLGANA